jgi:hypothetical protein
MKITDIRKALKDFCTDKGLVFLYGRTDYINAVESNHEYLADELVMVADFEISLKFANNLAIGASYSGIIMLGRKSETNTVLPIPDPPAQPETVQTISSLDETMDQKYDRRLSELLELLQVYISQFACANELEVNSVVMSPDINKFDTNLDFVVAKTSLSL